MRSLTEFLADPNAKLGLFESPTGTVSVRCKLTRQGKTLSMLCALLSHHLGMTEPKNNEEEDDWLSLFDSRP